MMNWAADYTTLYYGCLVDKTTWRDSSRFEILSGSISRVGTNLRESADLTTTDYEYGTDRYIRIWMDVSQNGSHERVALFTGLTSTPDKHISGFVRDRDGEVIGYTTERGLKCYSVLKPAQDVFLERGWWAGKGMISGELIKKLLSVCPAPVEVDEGSPRLADHIIAEDGETNLTMVYKILEAIGWRIRITGEGIIQVLPFSSEPVATFSEVESDMLETEVTVTEDWFECPNVFRAVSDGRTVIVYDNEEGSGLSTIGRGREIWTEETGIKLSDAESLQDYARRKLKELQSVSTTIEYERSYLPDVLVTDRIRLHYPAQGLDGIFAVESQNIALDHCGTTSEEVISA